ncbi:MAG: aminotransferase class I/II-fold pyridoxal phosphate-dependent enzyme [Oscillospiraceae bacterium]|nr:aminotransferase class I/II-fold pyridoxal phosphate-dependent enzyme [Oscillospiraceae bacterium]
MIRFECDYGEGAAQPVLDLLQKTNLVQTPGYGTDDYCEQAREQIRRLCDAPDAGVHFFVGATQANFTFIDAALKPWQGVLCADSAHIHVHETGAVEATGHKCLALPSVQGKITAEQIQRAYDEHWANDSHEHIVQPGMVYLSNPTEDGTLYSKEELTDISAVCYACGLYLFVDGARMAYGLTSPANDLSLQDYANLCDAFYLGGTKCGALFGEALVIINEELNEDFRYAIKQHGGMLAKGRLLGLQFLALLDGEDGSGCSPYYRMAARANKQALRIRAAFEAKGCPMLFDSPTNQQFPIIPDEWLEKLNEKYATTWTAKPDETHTAVRFCTSWATREEDVETLLADIAAL